MIPISSTNINCRSTDQTAPPFPVKYAPGREVDRNHDLPLSKFDRNCHCCCREVFRPFWGKRCKRDVRHVHANRTRDKRILTNDFVLPVRQVVADHTAYVSADAVTDTMDVVRRSAGICEMGVELSRALCHQPAVAQRRQVTREERQWLPVYREHVVVFSV